VLLALVQIGGLGLITMTLFFISLFMDLGLNTQLMAGQILEIESWKNIKRILIFIILVTLYTELIGALLVFAALPEMPKSEAWLTALFHSVASFCNAGFSLLTPHPEIVGNNPLILITTMVLMIIGGLGFVTWYEIVEYISSFSAKQRHRFSLHSKIILYASTILFVITATLFWILEHNNTLAKMSIPGGILNSIFHAISFKSAGFVTTSVGDFQIATLFLIMIIGFIGSSPGSTGSGIKITTFVLFLATIKASIHGRTDVEIGGRRIPIDQIYRVVAIIAISVGWVLISTFCLLITEKDWSLLDTIFETSTAFTSLGLSTGITSTLSVIGKMFIIITMFIGRIGSFTMILALRMRRKETSEFTYPEERVMLG
jgi:trk system potassium uptake protein TrkH